MILLDALSIALAAFALYQVSELGKRVKALEARKPEPEKRVQAPVQDWNKPIEGFNPKKPSTVLPRSEEERNARLKTVREVNENVFEFDSKI